MTAARLAACIAVAAAAGVAASGDAAAEAPVQTPLPVQADVPFYCHFVPEHWRTGECRERGGGGDDRCRGLSDVERAQTPACSYSQDEAVTFAYLSSAAACGAAELAAWDCGRACDRVRGMRSVRRVEAPEYASAALVGRLRDRCVVAFQGTESIDGWVENLRALSLTHLDDCRSRGRACRVGEGFLDGYKALSDSIRRSLEEIGCGKSVPLSVTGFSRGAALAALAIFDLRRAGYNLTRSYTFGQPRVGDATFAAAFNEAIKDLPLFRVARADDPIVYLPARDPFHHVGTEIYYPGDTDLGFRICDGTGEDEDCAGEGDGGKVTALVLQCLIPRACGHLRYLQPAKADLMSRPGCAHNDRDILYP